MNKAAYEIILDVENLFFDEGRLFLSWENGKIIGEGLLTSDFIRIEEEDDTINLQIFERSDIVSLQNTFTFYGNMLIPKEYFEVPLRRKFLDCGLTIIIDQKLNKKETEKLVKELKAIKSKATFIDEVEIDPEPEE